VWKKTALEKTAAEKTQQWKKHKSEKTSTRVILSAAKDLS